MVKKIIVGFICMFCLPLFLAAEEVDSIKTEPISKIDSTIVQQKDTIVWVEDKLVLDKQTEKLIVHKAAFKPNPTRAVLYSAIFPGLGQIYNRKYWKLPLVYGGFLGLTYAISWNGRYYNDYTKGYKALMREDYKSDANFAIWGPFVKRGGRETVDAYSDSEIATLRSSFKRSRDSYRRYRDLSIIGAVALYALCMIDAYVDAHLFDFNISPDLSLKVEPISMNPLGSTNRFSEKSYGVQCSIQF